MVHARHREDVRFLLDENVDVRVGNHLRSHGHDVTGIAVDYPASLPDRQVLAIAHGERRILITHDRDVGELVFVRQRPHAGVILLRVDTPCDLNTTIALLDDVLVQRAQELHRFIVVTERQIRVR